MRILNFKKVLVLAAMLASGTVFAAGEQTGRIFGTITEAASGAPVPGATVTVSGPSLIGGPQTLTSGDDGRYQAIGLPPGRYDVEVSYSGVKPIRRRVIVRLGETTPLDIAWSPELAEAEVTVVVEERHMTKPDSTQTGSVISSESESKIAMGDRRYQFFANQVAGVVGLGTGLFQSVKGGNEIHNRYLIDGLDISDPITNTFSANLNLDTVASEEVLTGGMEAQYNSLGGVFNVITASGSDEWHVDASLYINNAAFSAPNRYGSSVLNGYRQFLTRNSPPTQSYQANINVGGPILKHRLWFNLSAEYFYEEFSQPAAPPINVEHPSFYRHQFLGHLKITWAPNDRHRVTLVGHTDPAFLNNLGGRFQGEAALGLGVTETRQNQGGAFMVLTWDYFKSQNLNTTVNLGYQFQLLDNGPQGILGTVNFGPTDQYGMYGYSDANKRYDAERPRHINLDDSTIWYQGPDNGSDRRHTISLDPSLSVRGNAAGYHDAKFGMQSRFMYHTYNQHRPGLYTYSDLGGGPGETGLCQGDGVMTQFTGGCFGRTSVPDFAQTHYGVSLGFFLQDRWKPFKRLTILPGIRFDWGLTRNSIGQTVSNMFGVGPRLGATVDLTGDSKTIFSVFYGRANDVANLLATAIWADISAVNTTETFNPVSRQFEKDYTSGGAGGYRIDPNVKPPHTDEVTIGLRREVFKDSVAGIDYTYKRISNIWDAVELNQIWDPTGTRVVGYVNGQPTQIFQVATPDSNYRIYQGVDFMVESRPSPNWDLYAAYTASWLYGHGPEQLGQIGGYIGTSPNYNPRQRQFFDGFLPEDRRHNLKLRASYNWKGLIIGALFNYMSGAPVNKYFFNQNDQGHTNLRSPQGTEPGASSSNPLASSNDPARWSEFRLPDVVQVDVRLGYDFHALIKQHVIVMLDFFNAFNLSTADSIETANIDTFGTVLGRQRPFRFQLGLRYIY